MLVYTYRLAYVACIISSTPGSLVITCPPGVRGRHMPRHLLQVCKILDKIIRGYDNQYKGYEVKLLR